MHGTRRIPPLPTPGSSRLSKLLVLFLAAALALPVGLAPAAGTDDNIPNATLLTWGLATKGDKNFRTDTDDVYQFDLKKGQPVQLRLTGSAGTDFDMYLFPPTALNINDDQEVAASEHPATSSESINYTAAADGTHYVDVATWDTDGQYTLTGSVRPIISLKANRKAVYDWASPAAITLSGALDPLATGLNLKLRRRAAGRSAFAPLVGFASKSDGTFSYQIATSASAYQETADYRIEFAGATGYLAAQSSAVTIRVRPNVSLSAPSHAVIWSSDTSGSPTPASAVLSGTLSAKRPIAGVPVVIQRRLGSSGSFGHSVTAHTNATGHFSYTFSSTTKGTFHFQARYEAGGHWETTKWIAFRDSVRVQ
jgi:hypothetical protein